MRYSNIYYDWQNKSIRRIILISQASTNRYWSGVVRAHCIKPPLKSLTALQNDLYNNESFRNDYTKNQIDVFYSLGMTCAHWCLLHKQNKNYSCLIMVELISKGITLMITIMVNEKDLREVTCMDWNCFYRISFAWWAEYSYKTCVTDYK